MAVERRSSWADVILELYVDDENVATIPVSMVLKATERDKPNYKSLVRCIVFANKLRETNVEDDRSVGNLRHIRLSYRDDEGDDITFSTTEELREALEWAAEANRGRLAITADIPSNMAKAEPFDGILGAEKANNREALNSDDRGGPLTFLFAGHKQPSPNQTCDIRAQRRKNIFSFFLNGLGKADSVPVSKKQAMSPATPVIEKENAEQKNEVHRNILNIVGNKRFVALARAPDGVRFDAKFVHKRHACDGCNQEPIVGYRYHALNAYNIDLCEACYLYASKLPLSDRDITKEKASFSQGETSDSQTGDSLVFQLAQRKTDQAFKRVPRLTWLLGVDRLAQDIVGFVLKVASRRRIHGSPVLIRTLTESPSSDHAKQGKPGETMLTMSDFDLQVAIQQSLRDLRRSTSLSNMDAGEKSDEVITPAAACADAMEGDNSVPDNDPGDEPDPDMCFEGVALTSTDDEGSETSDQFEAMGISDLNSSDMIGFDEGDWCAL